MLKVIGTARMTRDVTISTVYINGTAKSVLNNALAGRNSKGETTFIDFSSWDGTAELMGRYLKKGDQFTLVGDLRNRIIKGADGKDRTVPFVLIEQFEFIGNKRDETKGIFDDDSDAYFLFENKDLEQN